ncbi:GTP-binding protein [Flammeovirga sp. MY04]|uniref:CobW family GTP-binding protein n=1 Tax=Flammeovirga sp. MY04 TaxID=1191459 RepID=UPI000806362A|nr:GTP-binding protein [Flammeovirga sp. MY04]ANQ50038.1 GTP-binding protein [Flammeovirga sp. MY04]
MNSIKKTITNPLDQALDARQTMSGLIFAAMALRNKNIAPVKTIPLTILGGFLGAGKTTMLNHILQNPGGKKITVLVNDFGKINIDATMVESQTDDMISLTNGCACCAVSSDLTKTLIDISEKEEQPDAIILECSGVAEPGSIAQIVLSNKAIRLDGIITLVDAETFFERLEDESSQQLFINQLTSADIISIGKTDLVSEEEKQKINQWIAKHQPNKAVLETVEGDVPTDVILGVEADHNLEDEKAKAIKKTNHKHTFESVSFSFDQPFKEEKINAFIKNLPAHIIRAKGILQIDSDLNKKMIYQRVSKRWSLKSDEQWGNESPVSKLVFIAKKGTIDKTQLKKELEEALYD